MLAFVLLKYDSNAKVRWSDALNLELEEKKERKDINILLASKQYIFQTSLINNNFAILWLDTLKPRFTETSLLRTVH